MQLNSIAAGCQNTKTGPLMAVIVLRRRHCLWSADFPPRQRGWENIIQRDRRASEGVESGGSIPLRASGLWLDRAGWTSWGEMQGREPTESRGTAKRQGGRQSDLGQARYWAKAVAGQRTSTLAGRRHRGTNRKIHKQGMHLSPFYLYIYRERLYCVMSRISPALFPFFFLFF